MGILWWSSSAKPKTGNSDSLNQDSEPLPSDLANYLESKDSELSNREFKSLLRRQSDNAKISEELEKEDESQSQDFLSMVSAPAQSEKEAEKKIEEIRLPTPISTSLNMKTPMDYTNYELEKYKRENDEKECVLINCSEIQHAFFECLGTQSVWDKIGAATSVDGDQCNKLADFFMACTKIQKNAFIMFDYSTLSTIEEMKNASKGIDEVFTRNFQSLDDVQDKEKFLRYTKELRDKREEFYQRFGK